MSNSPPKADEALQATVNTSAAIMNAAAMMTAQTDQAIAQTRAAFEQMAIKSREALEQGVKTADVVTGMARGNMEAFLESSRVASGGLQVIAREVAAYSKENLERTTSAARALTQAKTAPEFMRLQNEFAQAQFASTIGEVTKLSETMFKMMTDIFAPLQKQSMAVTQAKSTDNKA
jgi:phasin family protein